jgi:hypothetical protein
VSVGASCAGAKTASVSADIWAPKGYVSVDFSGSQLSVR